MARQGGRPVFFCIFTILILASAGHMHLLALLLKHCGRVEPLTVPYHMACMLTGLP